MEGTKNDQGKLRIDLIPPEVIFSLAHALTYGASKYEDRNWEKGIRYSRIFGALQRHLWKFWSGKNIDEESGLLHLELALCELSFLLIYYKRNMIEWDNRSCKEN